MSLVGVVPRPFKVFRSIGGGWEIYASCETKENARASVKQGKINHPGSTFRIMVEVV